MVGVGGEVGAEGYSWEDKRVSGTRVLKEAES